MTMYHATQFDPTVDELETLKQLEMGKRVDTPQALKEHLSGRLYERGYIGKNSTGQLTITARLRIPMNAPAQPIVLHDWNMVRNIDPPAIGDLLGTDLTPYYLQLASGQPGSLEPMPVPSVESGPYLSYGLQWMTFGVVAPLGLVYFVWSELRQRRRLDDEDNDAAEARPQGGNRAAGPGEDATASLPAPSGVPTTTGGDEGTPDEAADSDQLVAAAMRDRYGDRFASEQRRSWRRGNRFDV